MIKRKSNILVTGGAGFIGMHTIQILLNAGYNVYGIDNLAPYGDLQLKRDRLSQLEGQKGYIFERMDITNRAAVSQLFQDHHFDLVINLAAQAGVRYSLGHPATSVDANIVGFGNILEGCRHSEVRHLIYASSSSVYGRNTKVPFAEEDPVDLPSSLYAATKRANELMAESYHHLFGLPCTGLRFFSVYGPWGRPDMAYFKFTRMLFAGEPLPLFNAGNHRRDMTYIDDIVLGIQAAVERSPEGHRIYNLGNSTAVELMDMVRQLEDLTGKTAQADYLPFRAGDVYETYADFTAASAELGFTPTTRLADGLEKFIAWYKEYFSISADS